MMLSPRPALLLGLALLGLAACSSPNPYEKPFRQLSNGYGSFETEEYGKASRALERLLSETNTAHKDFIRQRYFASYVLMRSHLDASIENAFLKERVAGTGGLGGIGGIGSDSQAGKGRTQDSPVGHLMASILHATNGINWADRAGGSKKKVDGQVLVPEGLEELGVDNARTQMQLALLIVYGRLSFEDKVIQLLDKSPSLLELESCEEILANARVGESMRPWVYMLVHHHLRRGDHVSAYKFGIRTLETASHAADTIPESALDEVTEWITNGADYVFKCPDCKTPVIPSVGECSIDAVALLDFYGEPRP